MGFTVQSIVRLPARTQASMTVAMTQALARGASVRIATGSDDKGQWVKWDSGSGWTPPYYGEQF